jgi:3-mercaptopropionate dioxygenase
VFARKASIEPARPVAPGLDGLATAVRAAVGTRRDWRDTAQLVASELERHLPSPSILPAEQRIGHPGTYRTHLLYSEPDGCFSIVALVWRPGQQTPIHDHVTWCVFGVIQGMEYEELFALDENRGCLIEAGTRVNKTGEVSGFAPPGDIHRVRNASDRTAISIHIYGTDVSRIGSSVRRCYDLPVQSANSAAGAVRRRRRRASDRDLRFQLRWRRGAVHAERAPPGDERDHALRPARFRDPRRGSARPAPGRTSRPLGWSHAGC